MTDTATFLSSENRYHFNTFEALEHHPCSHYLPHGTKDPPLP